MPVYTTVKRTQPGKEQKVWKSVLALSWFSLGFRGVEGLGFRFILGFRVVLNEGHQEKRILRFGGCCRLF